MPGFHHPVIGTLGRDGAAVELARQPDREVANIDHLLNFARALGHDLAGLERHQRPEIMLGGAQLLGKKPHQLATPRRRHRTPGREGKRGAPDDGGRFRRAHDLDVSDQLTGDRRHGGKSGARERALRHAEPGHDGERLVAHRLDPDQGRTHDRPVPPKRSCGTLVSGRA